MSGRFERGYIRAIVDDENKLRVAKYIGNERWAPMNNLNRKIIAREVYGFNLNLIMFLLTLIAVQDRRGYRDITITNDQYKAEIELHHGGSNKKIKNKRYKKSKRR